MTTRLTEAVAALCLILEAENRLLEERAYAEIGRLLPGKQAALQALEACGTPDPGALDDAGSMRLVRLVQDNRAALKRALHVQGRIMGIMADAARSTVRAPIYGGKGTYSAGNQRAPVAILRQA